MRIPSKVVIGSSVLATKHVIIEKIKKDVSIPMGGYNDDITPFVGNQHNPNWVWSYNGLFEMTLDELLSFYGKNKR